MAVTLEQVAEYVGSSGEYDILLTSCLAEAEVLVSSLVGSAVIPQVILDRAVLEVAADLFNRRNAPNGITSQQFATFNGVGTSPVRINRDPLAAAYPLLKRWITPWGVIAR
ncbi:hypothetical protein OG984_06455 [Nocardioides sp. NBC_00368]|uniref:hypothetical protein n=1 Tax=Nocardioides sp. NBC_00368 TaxID=2976000 RepID=UPI002E23B16B